MNIYFFQILLDELSFKKSLIKEYIVSKICIDSPQPAVYLLATCLMGHAGMIDDFITIEFVERFDICVAERRDLPVFILFSSRFMSSSIAMASSSDRCRIFILASIVSPLV